VAGCAGGLLAQTTQFVGLEALSFTRSASVLIMLVLGGAGGLYGGFVGAARFMTLQDLLSGRDPVYWQFWIGLCLVLLVFFARGGVLAASPGSNGAGRGSARRDARSLCRSLSKRWGGFVANERIDLELARGARHALIGPNGAGKTTLINLLCGAFPPSAGEVFLAGERITQLPPERRVKRGLTRTFQINSLFWGADGARVRGAGDLRTQRARRRLAARGGSLPRRA
jgi:ABC-type multidrug transport system fused ATPase/permease subunit